MDEALRKRHLAAIARIEQSLFAKLTPEEHGFDPASREVTEGWYNRHGEPNLGRISYMMKALPIKFSFEPTAGNSTVHIWAENRSKPDAYFTQYTSDSPLSGLSAKVLQLMGSIPNLPKAT